MIVQSKEQFEAFLKPIKLIGSELYEDQQQYKIIKHLEGIGFEVIKIITANKAGNADIVACSTEGQFCKIEVKREKGPLAALQIAKLKRFWRKKAFCMVAYGYTDFKYKLNTALSKQT